MKLYSAVTILSATLLAATSVQAQEDSKFKLSGFASLVGGSVLNGTDHPPTDIRHCGTPCYVADWNNAGVYDNSFSLKPESRVGIQGSYTFNDSFSATAQVTSRAVDADPRLEWAYLSYKFGNWEAQVGRKRIPLYFYSDFQDIGVAYPWVTPPGDLYGWEATNYNGASLRYRGSMQDIDYSASIFTGAEKIKDARYFKLTSSDPVEVKWKNLVGGDLEFSKDWWTLRFVYVQNDIRNEYRYGGDVEKQEMKAYGAAFNADFSDWFILSEIGQNVRKSDDGSSTEYKAPAYTVGAGYRYGKWTPFLSIGGYKERDASVGYDPVEWRTYSMTLRYDINSSNALKAQLNYNDDVSDNYTGNATILRFSYDMVF